MGSGRIKANIIMLMEPITMENGSWDFKKVKVQLNKGSTKCLGDGKQAKKLIDFVCIVIL